MKERPIIFTGPMVRAILDGRKTQTRRVVRPQPEDFGGFGPPRWWNPPYLGGSARPASEDDYRAAAIKHCPYGLPGDRLWVREGFSYRHGKGLADRGACWYWANGAPLQCKDWGRKRSPLFMPFWASRITLEIVAVRVERLQEITEADAIAEGLVPYKSGTRWQGYMRLEDGQLLHQQKRGESPPEWMIEPHRMEDAPHLGHPAVEQFRGLWSLINAKRAPWESNPWAWVIEFRVIEREARG